MENIKQNIKNLRKNQTPHEKKLWTLLRNRQINNCKFRRQHLIGKYIVDFVYREKKIIIELDGGQHNEEESIKYDIERTKFLEHEGYRVIRFWNNDIDNNIEGVYQTILEYLE